MQAQATQTQASCEEEVPQSQVTWQLSIDMLPSEQKSPERPKSNSKEHEIPQISRKMSDWDEHEMTAYETLSPEILPMQGKQLGKIDEDAGEEEENEGNDNKLTKENKNSNVIGFYSSASELTSIISLSQTTFGIGASPLKGNGLRKALSAEEQIINKPKDEKEEPDMLRFEIRNLDTGEVFDSRQADLEHKLSIQSLSIVTRQSTHIESSLNCFGSVMLPSDDVWKAFWNRVKKNNMLLIDYAENGDIEGLRKLFLSTTDIPTQVNYRSLDDWTALHFAASSGHANCVAFLLQYGADPYARSCMQRTPLHSAAIGCSLECIKELVRVGGKQLIDMQDNHFNTALHLATENDSFQTVEFLLKQGADFTLKNHKQLTPFQLCYSQEMQQVFSEVDAANNSDHQKYERLVVGGRLQKNNRVDHVNKILQLTQSVQKHIEYKKIQKQEEKTRLIKEMSWKDFNFLKKLGQGSFGEVFLVEREKQLYAMKIQSKAQVVQKNLQRYVKTEKNALSLFSHPFIIKLQFAFQNNHYLFMVMEFAEGGDMGQYLNKRFKLPEEEARIYTGQIVLALEELHKQDIIFRDLKPDNVVLDRFGNAKLTDFGLSKEGIKEDTLTKSFCGSVAYLPPEILTKRPHSRTVDWYLLGTFLFELLVGIPPYYDNKKDVLFENIKKGPLKIPKSMSADAKDLIKKLLNRNPKERLGAKEDSEEIKSHPFFKDLNWDDLLNGKIKLPPIECSKNDTSHPLTVNYDQNPKQKKSQTRQQQQDLLCHIDKWSFIS